MNNLIEKIRFLIFNHVKDINFIDTLILDIFPDYIFKYNNFNISNTPLHDLFFILFQSTYAKLEDQLTIQKISLLKALEYFKNDIINIYIQISNTYWKLESRNIRPFLIRRMKIRNVKQRLSNEAKLYHNDIIINTEKIKKFSSTEIKKLRLVTDIPIIRTVSGNI
jgi:hypothetical protein